MDLHSGATTTPSSGTSIDRVEAERLLGISAKFLETRDLNGAREFALLAQDREPLLDGSDQILAIIDVLTVADKHSNNSRVDWYSILQIEGRIHDADLIKRNYRRLALLLHPDKNKYPSAETAFKLVTEAWAVLSDEEKKCNYDSKLNVELAPNSAAPSQFRHQQNKLPVRRSTRAAAGAGTSHSPGSQGGGARTQTRFWTACPYCYILYQYPTDYVDCCLRCQKCRRAFHGAVIPSLPPRAGSEGYYCCWAFFPLGYQAAGRNVNNRNSGFPNWTPAAVSQSQPARGVAATRERVNTSDGSASPEEGATAGTTKAKQTPASGSKRKRGRPRKNG